MFIHFTFFILDSYSLLLYYKFTLIQKVGSISVLTVHKVFWKVHHPAHVTEANTKHDIEHDG